MIFMTERTYYHLQTNENWKNQWSVGDKYTIGTDYNPFFAYYYSNSRSITINGQNYHVNDVSRELLNKHQNGNCYFGVDFNIEPYAMFQMIHYTLEHY
ncbi:hypothetical protein GCM10008018_31160 [Paenibacillus marchantiophytorum]|uniref:Uncharacterized protein n=1 Tax=Paenibacillus marchantiophytorum TaxID=1619310 RepID=A0ABQ1EQT6_9BACL|nr:hypothetical protein [Paenibacillus marchantiophytorum]GFZ82983.1 hypothetical protein GCM10008018_31160 [Paenibacillus marchantiophytorum]